LIEERDNMKIKKTLTILLTSMLLLTSSASVLASEKSETRPETTSIITPTVVGIGDTKATAITLSHGIRHSLYLSSSTDEDWFKWTNDTGSFKYIGAFFFPLGYNAHYRYGMEIDYNSSRSLPRVYAKADNPGDGALFVNPVIPPGATVYFVVDSIQFAPMQYTLDFYVYNF
jgi:hypothetical protein